MSITGDNQFQALMSDLVEVLENEEAHWVHQLLLNDVDQASAAVAHLPLANKLLHMCLVEHQVEIEPVKEVLLDTLQFTRHDGGADARVVDEIEDDDVVAKSVEKFRATQRVVEMALHGLHKVRLRFLSVVAWTGVARTNVGGEDDHRL